jgi:hypothetical protein
MEIVASAIQRRALRGAHGFQAGKNERKNKNLKLKIVQNRPEK